VFCSIALAAEQVFSLLSQYVRAMIDGTKLLARWLHGTVELTPPMHLDEDDDEPIVFSFYDDISQDGEITSQLNNVNAAVQGMFEDINHYLSRWYRYRRLWNLDQGNVVEKFAQNSPPVVAYDEKLEFSHKLGEEVGQASSEKAVGLASVCVAPPPPPPINQSTNHVFVCAFGHAIRHLAADHHRRHKHHSLSSCHNHSFVLPPPTH